jgi:hypothetical protein
VNIQHPSYNILISLPRTWVLLRITIHNIYSPNSLLLTTHLWGLLTLTFGTPIKFDSDSSLHLSPFLCSFWQIPIIHFTNFRYWFKKTMWETDALLVETICIIKKSAQIHTPFIKGRHCPFIYKGVWSLIIPDSEKRWCQHSVTPFTRRVYNLPILWVKQTVVHYVSALFAI